MKARFTFLALWVIAAPPVFGAGPRFVAQLGVYEVYTELTVPLRKPVPFTCEAGAEPGTLVLTVAAELKGDVPAAAGRIAALRVARAKGTTTFFITTTSDAGTFRARLQNDPPAVTVDVYRRLELKPALSPAPYLKFIGEKKVLLVDDDDGPGNGNKMSVDVDGRYRAALAKLGLPFELHVVRAGAAGPTAAEMAPYPVVIWFTGLDARPVVVSAADEEAMAIYVAAGGRLLLISQNYLSDACRGKTRFCRETLGITAFQPDTQAAAVTTPDGERLDLGGAGAIIGNWGDGFRPPADGKPYLTGVDGDPWCYGFVRGVGAGRVAFLSCALENLGYVGTMAEALAGALTALTAQ